jgi:hypothetical protein
VFEHQRRVLASRTHAILSEKHCSDHEEFNMKRVTLLEKMDRKIGAA